MVCLASCTLDARTNCFDLRSNVCRAARQTTLSANGTAGSRFIGNVPVPSVPVNASVNPPTILPPDAGKFWRMLKWLRSNKLSQFAVAVLRDYKGASIDIFASIRRRPIKASIYAGSLTACFILNYTAPDEVSFYHFMRLYANEAALVNEKARSPLFHHHMSRLRQLDISDQLRYQKLSLCSIIWRDDFAARTDLYNKNCEYLKQPDWLHPLQFIRERIEDVGILGHWLVLDNVARDYDVNDAEFHPESIDFNRQPWAFVKGQKTYRPLVKAQSQFAWMIPEQDTRWDNRT